MGIFLVTIIAIQLVEIVTTEPIFVCVSNCV